LNEIVEIKTVPTAGPNGPTAAMMIAINIDNAATGQVFISQVAEQFKLHRTAAPPDTSKLLVSIVGALSADQFATRWTEVAKRDGVVRAYMSMMRVADVIQGTKSGQQLSKASLLINIGGADAKPLWKFW
jgi:hypothetical protein